MLKKLYQKFYRNHVEGERIYRNLEDLKDKHMISISQYIGF